MAKVRRSKDNDTHFMTIPKAENGKVWKRIEDEKDPLENIHEKKKRRITEKLVTDKTHVLKAFKDHKCVLCGKTISRLEFYARSGDWGTGDAYCIDCYIIT